MKDGEAPVNAGSMSDSGTVSAIVLQRGSRTLIGPTGTSVVIPWLTVQLLAALSERAPHFVEAKQLQAMVWPDTHISPDALKQRVRLARQSLRDAGYDPALLDSVRGEGYALRVPLEEPPNAALPTEESPRAPISPVSVDATQPASWVQRFRIGIVAALIITTALVAEAVGIWPSFVSARANSRAIVSAPTATPSIGPVPVRVMLMRDVNAEPAIDAALVALYASTNRTLAEHSSVLMVPMPNGSACVNGPPAHLCARISGDANEVRLEVTDLRSGAALVLGEWSTGRVPHTLLTNTVTAAQLAVLLSPGTLRWIGEPRGRGDREFATLLIAVKAAASCDVEAWRQATLTLDETAERAPQFHVARALRALLAVAVARVDTQALAVSGNSTASAMSNALTNSDALVQVDPGQALAHAAKWLHALHVSPPSDNATRTPEQLVADERLRRLSPSVATLAEHLHTCIESGAEAP